MKPVEIRYFNDPVAVGLRRIAINVNGFSVISLLVSGSLLPLLRYLIIGILANRRDSLQIKSNFLRVCCKLVATFNNPVGSPIGFAIGSSNGKRTVISKHHRLHLG